MENYESIGIYLKSIRIQKDLTLSDLSEKTKIKIRHLSEIEDDDFNDLGGKGYARATIITYARALGADIDLILEEFEKVFETTDQKIFRVTPTYPRKYLISTNFFSIIFILILIIAIVIFALTFYKDGKFTTPFNESKQPREEKTESSDSSSTYSEVLMDSVAEIDPEETINREALHDTTDHAGKFIFKDKESPFHIRQ